MGQDTKAYYEGFEGYSDLYDSGVWREYRRQAADWLRAALPARSGLRVLDLGGGAALSLRELHADPRVAEYQVVDLVVKLPPGLPKVKAAASDALAWLKDYAGPPFDAAVIFGVLEYMKEDEAAEVLRRLPLASGAPLLVHEPNARAAAYMETGAGAQRPVELVPLPAGCGLSVIGRRDRHVPLVRAAVARLGIRAPLLLRAALAAEGLLGGGVDSLYLLKK